MVAFVHWSSAQLLHAVSHPESSSCTDFDVFRESDVRKTVSLAFLSGLKGYIIYIYKYIHIFILDHGKYDNNGLHVYKYIHGHCTIDNTTSLLYKK